jgi:hypothetical protein
MKSSSQLGARGPAAVPGAWRVIAVLGGLILLSLAANHAALPRAGVAPPTIRRPVIPLAEVATVDAVTAPPTTKPQQARGHDAAVAVSTSPVPADEVQQQGMRRTVEWAARDLYLPVSKAARAGFARYETKQKLRDAGLIASWKKFPVDKCRSFVPECQFFEAADLPLLFRKCCAEHTKLREAFEYTMDAADALGIALFLDSGTLLSAARDGGHTLVPWETDIDLGVVGVEPEIVSKPFAEFRQMAARLRQQEASRRHWSRRHLFEKCLTKVSKNASRNGRCRDAHYVYYAETAEEAAADTSRVEIWPFWPEPGLLVHPTRKKLSVAPELVLPMSRCWLYGRQCWCPGNTSGYLDHEYGADGSWRRPRTIHWGQNNVLSVTGDFTTRPPRRGDPGR